LRIIAVHPDPALARCRNLAAEPIADNFALEMGETEQRV